MSLETTQKNATSPDPVNLLRRLIDRIRRSLELEDILKATVIEVGEFLGSDRVAVYQLHADHSGQVIAESIRPDRLPSLLGASFPDEEISTEARELMIESQIRSIVNVASGQSGQSCLVSDETGFEPIQYHPAEPEHLSQLSKMGVQSSLVLPILSQDQLWGLWVCHHCEPHQISEHELQTVQSVVDQVSIAIGQSILKHQVREMANREAAIHRISSLLHSLSSIELQGALEETVATLQGSGGRLWIQAEPVDFQNPSVLKSSNVPSNYIRLYTCGIQPTFSNQPPYHLIEQCSVWQKRLKSGEAQIWAIDDFYQESDFQEVQSGFASTPVRGILMMPLWYRHHLLGYLSIFRSEAMPQQADKWVTEDIELACALGKQFATAIQQHEMHQQLHILNASLEAQVIERTTQLQQATEQLSQAFHNLRKTQSQLTQTEKMSSLGELVTGVAHEINNPVNFIHGNLSHVTGYANDLLTLVKTYQACYPHPSDEVAEQAEEIDLDFLTKDLPKTLASMKVGTDRIRQIVLSLRNFSRLDQLEMKPANLHEGLDSTLLILQHRLNATDLPEIKLVKDYGDIPAVECHAGQLNQVFMNVISNAIDALEEHPDAKTPTISIWTARLGHDRVIVCIGDNGPGIPKDVQDKMFETFFTTKPIGKGTGMGLSISYEIVVEKHGGVFRCHSQPGHGTEFWIEIPIDSKQPT
ncbi:MAG: GAF domain-containing protein [Phormidesmis sp. CAN_BIN36]|nr:GAF domain-containing protein [Phormidesmis sp. CAN_BIN36]